MIQRSSVDGVPDLPEQQRSGQTPARWHACELYSLCVCVCVSFGCYRDSYVVKKFFVMPAFHQANKIHWVKSFKKFQVRPPNRGLKESLGDSCRATLPIRIFHPMLWMTSYHPDILEDLCLFGVGSMFFRMSPGDFPWPKTLKMWKSCEAPWRWNAPFSLFLVLNESVERMESYPRQNH